MVHLKGQEPKRRGDNLIKGGALTLREIFLGAVMAVREIGAHMAIVPKRKGDMIEALEGEVQGDKEVLTDLVVLMIAIVQSVEAPMIMAPKDIVREEGVHQEKEEIDDKMRT